MRQHPPALTVYKELSAMYLQNKYTRWYNNIILIAQNRNIEGYVENHHIIPKSLGGSNDPKNLVKLTAREHFICHWLLTKMTVGSARAKMLNAAFMMATNCNPSQRRYKIKSRVYEQLRKEWANRPISDETRKKISLSGKGRKHTIETRKKNSEANSGKNNPMYGKTHTPDARKRISEARKKSPGPNKGKSMTVEQKEKIRISIKARYALKKKLHS